jgi:hypothetical protein
MLTVENPSIDSCDPSDIIWVVLERILTGRRPLRIFASYLVTLVC